MRFGVPVGNLGTYSEDGVDACLEIARRADSLGFYSVWVHDHVAIPEQRATPYPYGEGNGPRWDADLYEPLVMMAALAAVTTRVRIGVSVLAVPFRHPAIPAKMLAVVDQLSGGRVTLGAGTGWMREEFEALGLPAEHYGQRGAVTEEYLRAIKEMWTNTGPSNFEGRFVRFRDVGTFPKPVQRPHPPIVIAGKSENALRRASRLGNGYQSIASTPAELAGEVEQLRAICQRDRRDPDELEISLLARIHLTERPLDAAHPPLTGSPEQVMDDLRAYGKAGLGHLVATPSVDAVQGTLDRTLHGMDVMAREILPAFR